MHRNVPNEKKKRDSTFKGNPLKKLNLIIVLVIFFTIKLIFIM